MSRRHVDVRPPEESRQQVSRSSLARRVYRICVHGSVRLTLCCIRTPLPSREYCYWSDDSQRGGEMPPTPEFLLVFLI